MALCWHDARRPCPRRVLYRRFFASCANASGPSLFRRSSATTSLWFCVRAVASRALSSASFFCAADCGGASASAPAAADDDEGPAPPSSASEGSGSSTPGATAL